MNIPCPLPASTQILEAYILSIAMDAVECTLGPLQAPQTPHLFPPSSRSASALDAVITANLTAAEAHFSGQAQQHNAEWKYAGDNRVPWVPLRADLNDLVEAA